MINDIKLSRPIFVAISKNAYTGSGSYITASQICESPRLVWGTRRLRSGQFGTYQDRVSDNMITYIGTTFHDGQKVALQDDPTFICENRIEIKVDIGDGNLYTLSGEYDCYDIQEKSLYDYKTMLTGGWNKINDKLYKYTIQLNIYKLLLEMTSNHKVEKMFVQGALYDWREMKGWSDRMYPDHMFPLKEVPIMERQDLIDFIKDAIRELIKYEQEPLDKIPYCSKENRWQNEKTWKVIKLNKDGSFPEKLRAIPKGLFVNDELGAIAFCKIKGTGYGVKEFESLPTKCINYCELSRLGLCDFLQTQNIKIEDEVSDE